MKSEYRKISGDLHVTEDLDLFGMVTGSVAIALSGAVNYVGKNMMDPVYGVSRVDKVLDAKETSDLCLRLRGDAQRAVPALIEESTGNHSKAIASWKYIFLSGFPG
jgi:hypothetical protein